MNPKNVQSNFRIINFVPYNPENIIDNLNFKFHTFTLSNFHSMNSTFINLNMLCTTKNAIQNFVNLKFKLLYIGIIYSIIYID